MSLQESTKTWLEEAGLGDSCDPDVKLLVAASGALDRLNSEGPATMKANELEAARDRGMKMAHVLRRSVQALIDRADSQRSMQRHQLLYSGIAAESLGWIDADLLSPDLRARVADWLLTEYGVELAEPVEEEL